MKYVVPLAAFSDEAETLGCAAALVRGGIGTLEIAFRTPFAAEAIALCAERFPTLAVGAGTVTDGATATRAIACGAKFIVSPGLSEEVLGVCLAHGVPYVPGAVTPTEIMRALSLGIQTVKFFPAEMYGGLGGIRALSAPFPQVKFFVTGGVDFENLETYLACDAVCAVGGSFVLKGDVGENCRRIGAMRGIS